eukprot:scaffold1954_cov268-Pinguiococcus_pyrenoidosus.AAC.180
MPAEPIPLEEGLRASPKLRGRRASNRRADRASAELEKIEEAKSADSERLSSAEAGAETDSGGSAIFAVLRLAPFRPTGARSNVGRAAYDVAPEEFVSVRRRRVHAKCAERRRAGRQRCESLVHILAVVYTVDSEVGMPILQGISPRRRPTQRCSTSTRTRCYRST